MLASASYAPAHLLPFQTSDAFTSPSKRQRLDATASHSQSHDSNKYIYSYYQANPSTSSPIVVNTSDIPIDNIDLYMPHSYDFPSSQNGSHLYAHENPALWSAGGDHNRVMANSIATNGGQMSAHQRHPSTSSVGSNASVASSPYQAQQMPRGMRGNGQFSGKQSNISHGNQRQQSFSRSHLPTPTQTPTRNSFASQQQATYPPTTQGIDSAVQASLLMNSALLQQQHSNDDGSQSNATSRQAVSTPPTSANSRRSGPPQLIHNDSMSAALIPKFNRTVTDAYQDNLYFAQPAAATQHASDPTYLMPSNSMVNDRLLEAQMARSQSSGSNKSQPMSPFRAYANVDDQQYQVSPQASVEPKTISPKEALLDYNAGNDYPLFPQTTAVMNNAYVTAAANGRQDMYSANAELNYQNQNWPTDMQAFSAAPMQSMNSFATPALPTTTVSMNNMNGYGSNGMLQTSRGSSRQTEHTPEFTPAQLTRMESSASEAPQSSQASSAMVVSPKPASAADSGTYSCTYHGCVQRFTTPQKLQKHKRDTHRNNPNVTPGVGSGMSTAQLMERNSQTGPHICGRMNPTTGKACDAVFSRPYDLTRHEDTIHNIRKQKVRCAICTEEKTFSRSDALTRHMRVVHPEVDFPGKHRKRGSRDEA